MRREQPAKICPCTSNRTFSYDRERRNRGRQKVDPDSLKREQRKSTAKYASKSSLKQGRALYSAGKYRAAYEAFQGVVFVDPKNSEAYFYLGKISALQGNRRKAEKFFRNSMDSDTGLTWRSRSEKELKKLTYYK